MKRLLVLFACCFLTLPALAQSSPTDVVKAFYTDYTKAMADSSHEWMKALMAAQTGHVEKPLSDMLVRLADGDPNKNQPFLDFDPFSNSQTGIGSYTVGQPTIKGELAYVPVHICFERDPGPEKLRLRMVLRKSGQNGWKIANVAYPAADGMTAWDLKGYLKEALNS